MKQRWRNLLCFLRIVGKHDYDAPFYPDQPHQYIPAETFDACGACGGGKRHEVHRQPWDAKRMAQLIEDDRQRGLAALDQLTDSYRQTNAEARPLGDH